MPILRQKSGRPNAAEYQRPLVLQRFRAIARTLPGAPSEHELAQLAVQMQNYMEDHFGRFSPKPRLMTRLPASLFRDLREDGALAKILKVVLNYKREMNWSEIEFKNPEMNEAIQGLFLTIEHELKQMNLLQRPRVAFHTNVPPELVSTLTRILTNHGGEVVPNSEHASHLVQFDPEVDGNQSQEVEADYLRTLKMQPEEGIAFVHWWYYPDSYDEWIPLQDVEGQPPDEEELNRKPRQWRVCCRFIRDAEMFNEWGNELDYEVEDDATDESQGGEKKKKSDKSRNKAKKQEELARKRKEGILPEFIETTGSIMAEELRPTENPGFKRLRVAEINNGTQVVEDGPDEHAGNGTSDDAGNGPVAMQIAESKENTEATQNGTEHRGAPEVGSGGRKRYRPRASASFDALPEWFDANEASAIERRYLPEFFDGRSKHKTAERYLEIRNMIVSLYKQNPDQYLSATAARKQVPMDVSSVLRIHELLDAFGVINYKQKAEQERPQDMFPTILNDMESQDLINRYSRKARASTFPWSKAADELLLQAVAKHADDWEQVAAEVGGNAAAEECMHRFCELPLSPQDCFEAEEEKQELSVAELLEATEVTTNTEAVQAACSAAWDVLRKQVEGEEQSQTGSGFAKKAAQAVAAGLTGAAARLASAKARQTLDYMVDDYLAARLQSLEEKAKALEEMEKLISLESEKLELERRDLHVQRAKHALNIQSSSTTLR